MSIELKTCPFCGGRAVMKAVNKKYGCQSYGTSSGLTVRLSALLMHDLHKQ